MEPEREIEKLLRTYARKRRDDAGASPELHPAARRLLQSEVARRASKPSERNFFGSLFTVLRPRLAVAVSVLALALIAGWLVFSAGGKRKTQLAFEQGATERAARAVAEQPATAPLASALDARRGEENVQVSEAMEIRERQLQDLKPETARKDRKALVGGLAGIADLSQTADDAGTAASSQGSLAAGAVEGSALVTNGFSLAAEYGNFAPAGTKENADALVKALHENDGTFALAPNTYATPETSAANAAEREKALLAGDTALRKNVANAFFPASQRFVQVESASGVQVGGKPEPASLGTVAVLTAFKLEQNGREIRVVDEDGSIYSGSLQSTNGAVAVQTAQGRMTSLAKNAPSRAVNQEGGQNYSFRVSGTNRSLKQNVVFNGNLFTLAEGMPLSNQTDVVTLNWNQFQTVSNLLQLRLANSRISGTAVIDNRKQIQINAVPARP